MSNPVEALIATWRKEAAQWRHGIGDNARTQLLESHAAELASALASLRPSLDHVIPIADANTAHYVFSASPEVETLIAEMEQCLRDGRPSVNADRVRTWLASLRGAAEKPHAITRLKRDTWFDLNAPTDRTWPQGTRELCERAYQDGLAGRGAAEPEQPHPHVCHDRNPPFPGPCPACESERGEAAPVPAPPEKAENQTPADRASERNLA